MVDDASAERIFAKITSIPGLRPHQFILPNYPSYDDMYEKPEGLWAYGTWVNGGHWSTCEARMMLGYYRLGKFEDARSSMRTLLGFAERFRMDNPLVKMGSDVYQPHQPINLTYDAFGPPAAFVRGLFGYRYHAEGLTLIPHVPPQITRLEQRFPVRLGTKRLYLATTGSGPVTGLRINGKPWTRFDAESVQLPAEAIRDRAAIEIQLGNAKPLGFKVPRKDATLPPAPPLDSIWSRLNSRTNVIGVPSDTNLAGGVSNLELPPEVRIALADDARLRRFHRLLRKAGMAESYEAEHARLAIECLAVTHHRFTQLDRGKFLALAQPTSQAAADRSYFDAARKLSEGLANVLVTYGASDDQRKRFMATLWRRSAAGNP